jgi:ATP-dependent helicase/DNAse subunit B
VTTKKNSADQLLSSREFLEYYGSHEETERSELLPFAPSSLQKIISEHIGPATQSSRDRLSPGSTSFNGHIDLESLTLAERAWLERLRDRVYSVSQLETYALCPFKYFEKYILGLGETETAEREEGLSAMDRGLVLHEKLRRILEQIHDARTDDPSIDHRTMTADTFRAFDPEQAEGIRGKHPFWRVDIESTFDSQVATDLFAHFLEEEKKLFSSVRGKALRPYAFEQAFAATELPHPESDAQPIRLRGKIDRIDYDEGTGNVVVIDYKTRNAPKMTDIEEGLSLQLPLYLRIAEDLIASHTGVRGVAGYYHTLIGREATRSPGIGAQDFLLSLVEKPPNKSSSIYKHPENYEGLQKAIDKTVRYAYEYVEGMMQGQFPLVREDRTEKHCSYCSYRRSCRVSEAAEHGSLPKAGEQSVNPE